MRAPRSLRSLQKARRQVQRMNEMDRVIRGASVDVPTGFQATSGLSTIERGAESTRWMPHDYRPIVGFTANPRSTK